MHVRTYPLPFFTALVFVLSVAVGNPAQAEATPCQSGKEVHIYASPQAPRPGEPLQFLAVATDGEVKGLRVTDPGDRSTKLATASGGGPPWSVRGQLNEARSGVYRVEALRDGQVVACSEFRVGSGASARRDKGQWDQANEALYAAWIEHLFDAPPDATLSFPSLEPVLRDPARNFLYGYLSPGEDEAVRAEPDCADLPYFLRAYFAWKLGLPVASRPCDRGSAARPPRCGPATVDLAFVASAASADVFEDMGHRLVDRVHSGSARTALADEDTDFYPVPLERSALRPGTVFADPYGHTLVLVKWVPQTKDRSGILLAVDAQPDNSVARKRYWEGNFLFAATPSAGPGFKAYRAPVWSAAPKTWHQPANDALQGRSGRPPFSLEQAGLDPRDFYARMERLINPQGLDPQAAYAATLEALMEQLETRVRSVANGEAYMAENPGAVVPMPEGPAIFETLGPWEDYSTPSRDMRLLIAMKVLTGLPERIRRHPELFVLAGEDPEAAAARIEQRHARQSRERFIAYTRSDGSLWRLSLADIYQRRSAFEVAYNPNDCVERRWGATPGTPDFATCQRRAPGDQLARMEEYRAWFRETRRPPR